MNAGNGITQEIPLISSNDADSFTVIITHFTIKSIINRRKINFPFFIIDIDNTLWW